MINKTRRISNLSFETMTIVPEAERESQKAYWAKHSEECTVEAMMLDSQAAIIDQQERPEVRTRLLFPVQK